MVWVSHTRRITNCRHSNETINDGRRGIVPYHHLHQYREHFTFSADAAILCAPRRALEPIKVLDNLFGKARRRSLRALIDMVLQSTTVQIVVRYCRVWWHRLFDVPLK